MPTDGSGPTGMKQECRFATVLIKPTGSTWNLIVDVQSIDHFKIRPSLPEVFSPQSMQVGHR